MLRHFRFCPFSEISDPCEVWGQVGQLVDSPKYQEMTSG